MTVQFLVQGKAVTWHGAVYRYDDRYMDRPTEQRNRFVYECKHDHATMDEAIECAQVWLVELIEKKVEIESIGVLAERVDP